MLNEDLTEEMLVKLRTGLPSAWAGLDWRAMVYASLTTTHGNVLPIWYRQITPDGVKLTRPTQYGRSVMVDQFCRGYVVALQSICDGEFPDLPIKVLVKDGANGSYLMIRVLAPTRTTSHQEVATILGEAPQIWTALASTWEEWDLPITDQAALSFVMRVAFGETTGEEIAAWEVNASRRPSLRAVEPDEGVTGAAMDDQAAESLRLNATELAKDLGISVRNMQRYIAGQRGIPIEVLNRIIESRPDIDPRLLIAQLAKKRGAEDEDVVLN